MPLSRVRVSVRAASVELETEIDSKDPAEAHAVRTIAALAALAALADLADLASPRRPRRPR